MVKEQHKRYGSRGNYVSMRSSYFANFERSWLEARTKLARSLYEVGSKFVQSWAEVHSKLVRSGLEVGPKFVRSWLKVCSKLRQSLFEVGPRKLYGFIQRVQTAEDCF